MKIDRLITIIVTLLNRKTVTAKELAEKFEVSVRTIYRDIDTIDMAGIPIISYPGQIGGFGIMENYKLNNQLLTLNNLCSLLTTLNGINHTLGDTEIDSTIEKFRNLIPQDKSQDINLQIDQLIIEMPSWANTSKQKKMVKEIRYAIAQQNVLTINYRDYQSKTTLRSIEPISIIFKGYSWHLFTYCLLRNDYRVFRISRILALEIESENFTSRGLSYHDFKSNSHHKESLSITLKFTPTVRSRVEDIFEDDNIQVLKSGEMIVTAQFPDIEWCYSLILSFGKAVEVLGPNSVRNEIANKVKDMYGKYF